MRNILFIHQSAELYGSDKTLLLLLKHLDRGKYRPVVVLPCEGLLKEELEKMGIAVAVAPVLKLYRTMFSIKGLMAFLSQIGKAFRALDELHAHYKFDLVYSNTLAVLLGMLYARKRKIKHLWHVHEIIVSPKFVASVFPKLLDRYADVVVCNSHATRQNLLDRLGGLSGKTLVIHNGFEMPATTLPATTKTALGFLVSDTVITLVGRISRLKGHMLLLRTFVDALAQKPQVKLLFVGSPVPGQEYYLEEVEAFIEGNALQRRVTILPFQQDLSAVWQASDIVVVPSTEAESFGLVALEAMLHKKPVVGSNHGGLTEIISQAETGFLFEPSSSEALGHWLAILVDNPQLRNELGLKGHDKALRDFGIEKYIQRFEELFDQMLAQK